jgi:hypothetical protein
MEYYNLKIHDFAEFKIDDKVITVKMQKNDLANKAVFSGQLIPVVLRTGAVDHRIGFLRAARAGRDQVFGDIQFELSGQLEFDPVLVDDKLTGIVPTKLVLKKENPSA